MEAEIRHGVCSEVSLERAEAVVLEKQVIYEFEVKIQSNLSRRGLNCFLVQVNLHPFRRISTSLSLLIASLKGKHFL